MVSEPTIQPNFVVRGQRSVRRNPLLIVGTGGLILLFLVGIVSMMSAPQAVKTSAEPTAQVTNSIAFESEIIRETATPLDTVIGDSVALVESLHASATPETKTNTPAQVQPIIDQSSCHLSSKDEANVNIRSGPDLGFSIIGVLFAGHQSAAIAVTDNRWYEIETGDGGKGWVGGSVINKHGDCENLTLIKTPVCTIQNTSGNRVNIRTGASTADEILRVLSRDDLLMADARTADGWYRLNLAPQVGWVYQGVVALSDACSNVPTMTGDAIETPVPLATVYSNIAFNESDCVIQSFTGNSVDLREGPGMEFKVRSKLIQPMLATKRSSNGWYEIQGSGWAFAGDLVYRGLCNLLPSVTPDEVRLNLVSRG